MNEQDRAARNYPENLETMRAGAATLPRDSSDRQFLVVMAKALEDFARGLVEGTVDMTIEELDDLRAVAGKVQKIMDLMAGGANKDDPRVQQLYREVREDVG